MFVSHWMTRKVYTVTLDDGVAEAIRLMKEKSIKHLPVLKDNRLKGIISDRDIKAFTPSKATSLDIYELHYLLAKTKIKEVMKTRVVTTTPDTPIEDAAMLLYDEGIGCLPVLEGGVLTGIISDRDIFRVLIDITGVRLGGKRIFLTVEDKSGSIKEVADIIRGYGFRLLSILTSYERVREGYRKVVIRIGGKGNFRGLEQELRDRFRDVRIDSHNIIGEIASVLKSRDKG